MSSKLSINKYVFLHCIFSVFLKFAENYVMKKIILPITLLFLFGKAHAQVGINTVNPQGVFNVDGAKDNPSAGVPSAVQQANDFVVTSSGSVGIGTIAPDSSAKIDISASNKGALLPRVALNSNTDQTTILSPAVGLIVYNTGAGGLTAVGYLYWNGSEWRQISNSSTGIGTLGSISCSDVSLTPSTYTSGTAYTGILSIPYTGANGGNYPAQNIGPVNGLTATLSAGSFNVGAGTLNYTVSGTPTVSSPITTTFPINIGGKSCNATVGQGTTLTIGGISANTYYANSTTMNNSGAYFSANVKYGATMPIIDGLQFDVISVGSTYYKPILKNISGNTIVVHINTAAHSVNEGRQLIGLSIANGVEQGIDANDIVFWTGPSSGTSTAPVSGTNFNAEVTELFLSVRVATGNGTTIPDTYRFYRFLYQIVQFNGEKVLFTTLQRVL
ncbi:hypothetical protein SAMN05880573_105214 [Chryseobacterium sp. RU33C]|nr:hypothetical protein SAMN05880573_105214 [Chryseobacterium sp. RU33C]